MPHRTDAIVVNATPAADPGEMYARRETLLADHAHLVRHIAHHLFRRRTYVRAEELIEAGMVGLEEAMRRCEYDTVENFEVFATAFIRGAMLDLVRRANWSCRSKGETPHN